MTLRRFEAIYSEDEMLNRVQSLLEESLSFLKDNAILDGRLITSDITTSSTTLSHGLGRSYKGFIVVKTVMANGSTFTGSVYEDPSPNDELYLKLDTTANVTVSVWVF